MGEGFEEGEDGDFGFAEGELVVGGEGGDEGFDGVGAVDVLPDEGAEGVEVEGFFEGGFGEEAADAGGLEGCGEAEDGG